MMGLKYFIIILLVGLCWLSPPEAYSQSAYGSDTIRQPESDARGYSHRLFVSPTLDIPPGLIADVNAGFWVRYAINCCFIASPVFTAGIAPFDSMLYIEVGAQQIFEEGRKGYKFPANLGIRGILFRSSVMQLGVGYQYHDIYYHSRDYDLPPYYSLHWFYAGVAYTPTKNLYTINIGPRILDTKIVGAAVSLGASFRMSAYYSILIDYYIYGYEFGGGLWAGVRYHSENVKIDVATELGVGLFVTVGVPFR